MENYEIVLLVLHALCFITFLIGLIMNNHFNPYTGYGRFDEPMLSPTGLISLAILGNIPLLNVGGGIFMIVDTIKDRRKYKKEKQ